MAGPPRPTVRCVLEDLAATITDGAQRSAVRSGELPSVTTPLHELAHPIVEAARARYTGDAPPDRSELLRKVRDHLWAKCRHSQRWRGVVLWHRTEQRWLCFAGWREQGDPDDVYSQFEASCTRGSAVDSSAYLPTDDDQARLQAETIVQELRDQQSQLQAAVLATLLAAVGENDHEHRTNLPSGSCLTVRLVSADGTQWGGTVTPPVGYVDAEEPDDPGPEDDDWMGQLTLRVIVDWRGGAGAAEFDRVRDAIPGIAPTEWDILPSPDGDGNPEFWAIVDEDWISRLLRAVQEHGADVLRADPLLALGAADGHAHVADKASVARGYVEGELIRSVCGRRFVPTSDPDDRPICDLCGDFLSALHAVQGHLDELGRESD